MLSKHSGSINRKTKKAVKIQDPVNKFKDTFVHEFLAFQRDAEGFSRGAIAFSGSWKDWLGLSGVTSSFLVGGAVVSALAITGALTAGASVGVGLLIAVVGVAAEVAYVAYRSHKKGKEFKRATELLSVDSLDRDVREMARLLGDLYMNQLECSSEKNAACLAKQLLIAIKYEVLKNTHLKYEDLLRPSSLQGILLKSSNHIPKKQRKIGKNKKTKCNAQSAVKKPALYCRENDQLYSCDASRPKKYGVLYFDTKQELNDYRLIVRRIKNHHESWKFTKMISSEAADIRESISFFPPKPHANDVAFNKKAKKNEVAEVVPLHRAKTM